MGGMPEITVDRYGGTYSITRGDETRWSYARRLAKWFGLAMVCWDCVPPPRRERAPAADFPSYLITRVRAEMVERALAVLSPEVHRRTWAVERERELREEMMVRHTIEGRYPVDVDG